MNLYEITALQQAAEQEEDSEIKQDLQELGMKEDEAVYASLSLGYPDTQDGLPNRRIVPVTGNPVTYVD